MTLFAACFLAAAGVLAQDQRPGQEQDVFKGKLFPPNVILQYQDELELTRDQYTAIRQAVVATQSAVAEHEWDLREAYQRVLSSLDEAPIDKEEVLGFVDAALAAENSVKRRQVGLLIELRNLLTGEQIARLRDLSGE
jgi:Spy/CpxP family protein refolding chaperone